MPATEGTGFAVVGRRFVCLIFALAMILYGPAGRTQGLPPFTLKIEKIDDGGFPLNPKWQAQLPSGTQPGALPDPTKCRQLGFSNPSCTSDTVMLDTVGSTADGVSGHCVAESPIPGHVNWRPATYTGKIRWDEYSGGQVLSSGDAGGLAGLLSGGTCLAFCPFCAVECAAIGAGADNGVTALGPYGNDQDYNFMLQPDDDAGLTSANGSGDAPDNNDGIKRIGLEFNSNETIDHFTSPWWKSFRDAVAHNDTMAHDLIRDHRGIVTGLLGLDCEHDCHTELHPVYAMVIEADPDPANNHWVFFVRNSGNEGGCSHLQHPITFTSDSTTTAGFAFTIPQKPGFRLTGHRFIGVDNMLNQNTQVAFDDDKMQLQAFGVPNGSDMNPMNPSKFLDGELILTWERRVLPRVTKIDPSTTPVGTGATVIITGANFIDVQYVNPANVFNVASPTQITANVPGTLAGGPYQVRVETLAGPSTDDVLFFVGPVVTGISPSAGPVTGDTQVVVTGAGFAVPSGSSTISTKFFVVPQNGARVPVPWSECHSSTSCSMATPPSDAGMVDVIACVAGACSAMTAADRFAYGGPSITAIAPERGPVSGGTWVALSGASLVHDGRIQVHFDNILALQAQGCAPLFSSDDCTSALSPPSPTAGPVPVTITGFGSTVTAPRPFTYDSYPALSQIGYDASRVGDPPGWIGLNGYAPPGGASIALTSSDPAALVPPSTVNVPAGSQWGHFSLDFPPTPRAETVTLTANYEGSSVTTTIQVAAKAPPPPPPPLSIIGGRDSLGVGESTSETVILDKPAPAGGAVIALASSDPSAVPVPANVMVPADGSRGSFTVTNHYNGRPKAVKITAAYSGASAADTLTVPTPPPRQCPPRQCPRGFFWNSDDCACEAQ
jgi:hypothetical protein